MSEVLCLGNFVADVIGKPIERLPPPGQLLTIDTLETHVGGNGPNCALALAKLGVSVAALGRVGEDLFGRFLGDSLAAAGVETGYIARAPGGATGVTIVAVDRAGERSFLYHLGANRDFSPADIPNAAFDGARFLHVGSAFILPALDGAPLTSLLRKARGHGLTTTLDVCWDHTGRWMEPLAPCLPHVDYFLPSEGEAVALSGRGRVEDAAEVFLDRGVGAAIIKCGERGCYAAADGERGWYPAFRVPMVDATGAGDCFIAGFLCGLAAGWPLERRLRFANACGALAVSSVGATTGMRNVAEVETWMEGAETIVS